ncbi:TM2 domain-containing protein [Pseudokineococcus sp. 1T1Z-3]|uniref:TM2 domain-containing protein n=1 Tax=Pseudokineococcus sp. 1T1Z-3 TaxID=3132745 RepID=UPI0030965F10
MTSTPSPAPWDDDPRRPPADATGQAGDESAPAPGYGHGYPGRPGGGVQPYQHPQPPYPQPPYVQPPYPQPSHAEQPYAQQPYAQQVPPPGYGPGAPAPPPVGYKDTTVAYLLWFFLAWVGAHKFYLRQPGMGVLYIGLYVVGWLTVWFLVGGLAFLALFVLWVVDAVTMPDRVRYLNQEIHAAAVRGYR